MSLDHDARIERFVQAVAAAKPEKPTVMPVALKAAAGLLWVVALTWLAQWPWMLLDPDAFLKSVTFVNGYTYGSGAWTTVIVLTVEALVAATLWVLIGVGLLQRSIAARWTAIGGAVLQALVLWQRITGATPLEQGCFWAASACGLAAAALLMTRAVRHYFVWRER